MAVYFYQEQGGGPIKIGKGDDPRKRGAALQTGNPRPLVLLHTIPGSHAEEGMLHRRFAHLRIRGEWFRADAELLSYIETLKAGGRPPLPWAWKGAALAGAWAVVCLVSLALGGQPWAGLTFAALGAPTLYAWVAGRPLWPTGVVYVLSGLWAPVAAWLASWGPLWLDGRGPALTAAGAVMASLLYWLWMRRI